MSLLGVSQEMQAEVKRESDNALAEQARSLYHHRKDRSLSRQQFEAAWRKLIEENVPVFFNDPILALEDSVSSGLFTIEFARAMKKRSFRIVAGRIKFRMPPGLAKVAKKRNKEYAKVFETLIKFPDENEWEAEPSGPTQMTVSGQDLTRLLLRTTFLNLFTSLEVYLQDTLTQAIFSSREVFAHYSEKLDDDDIPTNLKGKTLRKWDYVSRWPEVIQQSLLFPYHEFETRVNFRYRAAFGFEIVKFPKLNRLAHFRTVRHELVHRGGARLGVPLVSIKERDVIELAHLVYELASFVETHRRKQQQVPAKRS